MMTHVQGMTEWFPLEIFPGGGKQCLERETFFYLIAERGNCMCVIVYCVCIIVYYVCYSVLYNVYYNVCVYRVRVTILIV